MGWGPNKEAGGKSAYNNVQVGGPQQRGIGFPISTDNASWGGPQHRSWRKVSFQSCASWRGPNIEKLEHQFLQAMEVGVWAPT
ncbi:TPA: hypothetical protein O7I49_002327 [Staphylococcus aureus]|nr:hypothetical protein [Staphylococcus aureus]